MFVHGCSTQKSQYHLELASQFWTSRRRCCIKCVFDTTHSSPLNLQALQVRLVRTDEAERYQALMQAYHYLGSLAKIGENLWYVATYLGEWVALVSFSSAALKCGVRDRWIGWNFRHQYSRLNLLTNNSRFLILPEWHYPNLASKTLSLCLKRLAGLFWPSLVAGGNLPGAPAFFAKAEMGFVRFQQRKICWRLLPSAARVRPASAAAHNSPSVRCTPLAYANDLTPCRMALHFDYASAAAPTSSKRPAPTATRGSSYTAPLALRFLYSFNAS